MYSNPFLIELLKESPSGSITPSISLSSSNIKI